MARILITEDEDSLRRFVARALRWMVTRRSRRPMAPRGWRSCRAAASICCCRISACRSWTASSWPTRRPPHFPALKILLMTGYAEQRERADDLTEKIIDVVSKPFALPDIRKAVALALAA